MQIKILCLLFCLNNPHVDPGAATSFVYRLHNYISIDRVVPPPAALCETKEQRLHVEYDIVWQ